MQLGKLAAKPACKPNAALPTQGDAVKYLVPLALALCLLAPAEAGSKVHQKPLRQTTRAYHPKPQKLKAIHAPRKRAVQHARPKHHGPAKQLRAHKPQPSR